jgi:acyl carrier protein
MTESLYIRPQCSQQPYADRRDALEDLVVAQFKRLLSMPDDEELPLDTSYFDLGLTSLRLTEIRQLLEDVLDIGIDATVLFNRPTVDDLVTHLSDLLAADAVPANSGLSESSQR